MKKLLVISALSVAFIACKNEEKKTIKKELEDTKIETKIENKKENKSFGEAFTAKKVINGDEMLQSYNSMKIGDSTMIAFKTKVNKVCKKKGCWMTLALDGDNEAMVKFKDYGFFVPLDSDGETVTVNGWAYVNEVPVDELRHYAEDAGKTSEEIMSITEPEKTYSFLATGVLFE